jgi:hypothetical protein
MSSIHFRVKAEDLKEALAVVSTVTPMAVGNGDTTTSAYLFKVLGDKNQAYIYSRDKVGHVARVKMSVDDVVIDGPDVTFTYPKEHTGGFGFFKEGYVTFDASKDGATFKVSAVGDRKGTEATRITVDPRQTRPCDAEYDSVRQASDGHVFPVNVLKSALTMAKSFLPPVDKNGVSDDVKFTAQIFDGTKFPNGDGYMFARTDSQTFYYRSDAFKGKSLAIHASNIDALLKFLGQSRGTVRVYEGKGGKGSNFAENSDGQVLGWTQVGKQHTQFIFPGSKNAVVLHVDQANVNEAIAYIQSQMGSNDRRVRTIYRHPDLSTTGTIQFEIAEDGSPGNGIKSWEIDVRRDADKTTAQEVTSLDMYIDIQSLVPLFSKVESSTSNQISLTLENYMNSSRRNVGSFRTYDDGVQHTEGDKAWNSGVLRYAPQFG